MKYTFHGKIIKYKRKKDGLTQPQLCEAAQISAFKLSRIEAHGDNITLPELARIGDALHMPTAHDWYREWEAMNEK